MNLGLFTDAFLKWSLDEVLDWTKREVPVHWRPIREEDYWTLPSSGRATNIH